MFLKAEPDRFIGLVGVLHNKFGAAYQKLNGISEF